LELAKKSDKQGIEKEGEGGLGRFCFWWPSNKKRRAHMQVECGLGWRCRLAQRKEGKGPRSGLALVAGLQLSSRIGPRLACWTYAREGEDRVSKSIRCSTKGLNVAAAGLPRRAWASHLRVPGVRRERPSGCAGSRPWRACCSSGVAASYGQMCGCVLCIRMVHWWSRLARIARCAGKASMCWPMS
jgi:hypothetical protein